jgi:5-methyltetrahydropteroyltriglutamate--homocysteine methyltransferase
MKRSTDRILITHAGSLARPKDLLEMMDAKLCGRPYDHAAYAKRIRGAVAIPCASRLNAALTS